jgi:hypothetical protein
MNIKSEILKLRKLHTISIAVLLIGSLSFVFYHLLSPTSAVTSTITVTNNNQAITEAQSTGEIVVTRTSEVNVKDPSTKRGYVLTATLSANTLSGATVQITGIQSGGASSTTNCSTSNPCDITASPTAILTHSGAFATDTSGHSTVFEVKITIPAGAGVGNYTVDIAYDETPTAPTPQWVKAAADNTAAINSITGDSAGTFTVSLDNNMIPIVNKASDNTYPANWCNYDARQWCNAITVTASTLSSYQNAAAGTEINEDDILGYWVYIPRYAYEVQRRDAVDKPIATQTLFDIRFETKTASLKTPIATTSTATNHNDYRTAMSANRTYSGHGTQGVIVDNTTWATHPAFWWDKNNDGLRDNDEELSGIWVGKYETTGSQTEPTIKPNLKSQINQVIGVQFAIAKGMGPNYADSGGNAGTYGQNYHNFNATATNLNVHQQKNTEWGAVAYLSTSIYGVGSSNPVVMSNTSLTSMSDGNGNNSVYGITGCGPNTTIGSSNYSDATIAGTPPNQIATSCSSGDSQRNYYGALGQLASTTQNVYGVYDMAGGAWEYVMGNRTTSTSEITNCSSCASHMETSPQLKYLNLYGVDITLPNVLGTNTLTHSFGTEQSWSSSLIEAYYNYDVCTWETCGGQALSETITVQSVHNNIQTWNSDHSAFVYPNSPWFERSGNSGYTKGAGVFATYDYTGANYTDITFRAALVAF